MAKYLVPCACGRQHAVDTRTGGRVARVRLRRDGRRADAPPAPPVAEAREEVAGGGGPAWGFRQGAITVSCYSRRCAWSSAAASRFSERPVPTIDPVAYSENVDQLVAQHDVHSQGWRALGRHLPAAGDDGLRRLQASGDRRDAAGTSTGTSGFSGSHWRWRRCCGVAAAVLGFAGRGDAKA